MKILFITDLYPVIKGESKTVMTLHNFVFAWNKLGHDVTVIRPNFLFNSFLRGKSFSPDGFYDYEGVKIFNVNYFTPFWFNIFQKIPKEIDFDEYDLVIAHMPSGIIFANKLIKKYKKPLICGVHVSDIEVLTNPIYGIYFKNRLKEAYKVARRIACRSFVLQKKFSAIMPELTDKTFVAASGVCFGEKEVGNIKEIEDKRSSGLEAWRSSHNKAPLTVLTCANLIRRKNIDKLILAMSGLEGFELKVIGDGPEFSRLKRLSGLVSNGLDFSIQQNQISFLGRLPHEKVLEEMRDSDIFILPSVSETFGMVYLEAMASGCVTVCTKNDGIDGIIKDGKNGFLCDSTVEEIQNVLLKIKNLWQTPEKIEEIIKNSLETIKDYNPEECAKNYLNR